jgi:hypothetical protein
MSKTLLPEVGQRVMVTAMPGDPRPVPLGTWGTVRGTYDMIAGPYIAVEWDNGRSLNLLVGIDRWLAV